ncbi:unnamed protein product, partial [Mesorhabditis belari]|uniref:Cystatin domain-containing protein n=1 Tax=Mesorhabditis belari TaxID=2138241 RepID=A0AAF3ELE5_9BILA
MCVRLLLMVTTTAAQIACRQYSPNEGAPGAVEHVDTVEVKDVVWHAIPALNADNDGNWIVPFKVVSATRQIVSGLLYKINVLTTETKCSKSQTPLDDINATNCPIETDGRLEKWEIDYQEQEWLDIHNYTVRKVGDLTWDQVKLYKKR